MSKPLTVGSRARASLAMLAAAMGAVAPVATVAPANASGTPTVQTPNQQQAPTPSTARAQAIQANQALGIFQDVGFGYGPAGKVHQVPKWNQRKAHKVARQTGRKIQKRYKR